MTTVSDENSDCDNDADVIFCKHTKDIFLQNTFVQE